jgi:hypothetical protein
MAQKMNINTQENEQEQEQEKHEHSHKHEQEQHAREKMMSVNKFCHYCSSSSMPIVQIKYLPAVGMLLESYYC